MTINNKSERNYRGKCLGWPVTSYGGDILNASHDNTLQSAMALLLQRKLFLQAIMTIQMFLCKSHLIFVLYKAVTYKV